MTKNINKLTETKCNLCFRKDSPQDSCMLYSERHAGIELCLGPFKNQEDRMKKVHDDFAIEKNHADLDKIARDIAINSYQRKKKLFDD